MVENHQAFVLYDKLRKVFELYWKLPTPVFIFIFSHTNVHIYKYMVVQILHYKQDLKSIVCLVHFIFTYILTLMMILVSHIKRQRYKVSIFYNKRLSSIMPEENKDCIKYVQVGNGSKFVSETTERTSKIIHWKTKFSRENLRNMTFLITQIWFQVMKYKIGEKKSTH